MTPPIELFHASELPERVQVDQNGKPRKKPIELKKCKLEEMIQYNCDVRVDKKKPGPHPVVCKPLIRTFRRCAKNLMVETTAWDQEIYGSATDARSSQRMRTNIMQPATFADQEKEKAAKAAAKEARLRARAEAKAREAMAKEAKAKVRSDDG